MLPYTEFGWFRSNGMDVGRGPKDLGTLAPPLEIGRGERPSRTQLYVCRLAKCGRSRLNGASVG